MELETIKSFLKVDFDDDNIYIELLIEVARDYIIDSVGSFDETKARMKLLAYNIISTLYENREYTVDKANEKVQYTLKSIVSQLQLDEVI